MGNSSSQGQSQCKCQVFEAKEVKSEAASASGRIKGVPESSGNERQIYCRANVLRVKGDIRVRIMMSVTGLRVKYGRPSLSLSYLIYAGTTSPPPFRPCTPLEVSQQSSGQGPVSLSSGPVPTALFSRKGQHTVSVTNSPSGWYHTASAFASCLTWKRPQTSWGPTNHAVEFLLWKMMVREGHWPNSMLSLHGLASLLRKEIEEKQELIAFKTDSPRSLWSPVKTLSADLETWSYGPKLLVNINSHFTTSLIGPRNESSIM